SLGVAAAAEFGIDLRRLVLIPEPGPQAAGVLAAIVDGFDVVAVGAGAVLRPGQRRRLLGRARTQRTAVFAPWREMPTRLAVERTAWTGVGSGGGYLRQRRLTVRRSGRRGERLGRGRWPTRGRDRRGGPAAASARRAWRRAGPRRRACAGRAARAAAGNGPPHRAEPRSRARARARQSPAGGASV